MIMTLHTLQQHFAHYAHISFVRRGDTIGIVVENAAAHAEILVRGAHLLSFTPQGQKPVIWNSTASTYDHDVTLHSGVPIIAPWFGEPLYNAQSVQASMTTQGMQRAHGFVRNVVWDIEEIDEMADDVTRITMVYKHHVTEDVLWCYPFRMTLIFTIGTSLDIEMHIHNTSDATCDYAGALHSYFVLSDVSAVTMPSFDSVTYVDTLDEWRKKIWKGDLLIDRERDYIFLEPPQEQRIVDHGWHRELVLETRGSHTTVVWNPWKEKAHNLSGFLPGDYQNMVCIETGQLHTDARTVLANEATSFGVTIHSQLF